MNRRSFLGCLAAGTGSLLAKNGSPFYLLSNPSPAPPLRLSVTWGMVSKMPVAEAFSALVRLGYQGYEMFDWRRKEILDIMLLESKKHPLECACITANKGVRAPGCGLVSPQERDSFLQEMEKAIEVAGQIGTKRLVVLTGNEVEGMSREAMMESAIAGLKAISPRLEKAGITAVVEILNTLVNHPGYFLSFCRDGARLVDAVGSPNVKLLFDFYHVQVTEGNLIQNFTQNLHRIGHIHIGDVPGRHQPGTGEIHYPKIFQVIRNSGYSGFVSPEYGPTVPVLEDLANIRRMASAHFPPYP